VRACVKWLICGRAGISELCTRCVSAVRPPARASASRSPVHGLARITRYANIQGFTRLCCNLQCGFKLSSDCRHSAKKLRNFSAVLTRFHDVTALFIVFKMSTRIHCVASFSAESAALLLLGILLATTLS
jgi:hypothetical protein